MEDKKKIGIVTLYHNSRNYGGLLQAFALVKVLDSFGVDAYQIDYAPKRNNQSSHFIKEIVKRQGLAAFLEKAGNKIIRYIYQRLTNSYYNPLLHSRKEVMDQFRQSIPHTDECDQRTINSITRNFNAFIVGSDQVWKPTVIDYGYSLAFADGKLTMAYAASLSVNCIPETKISVYHNALEDIDMISVREIKAQKILVDICDKKDIDCVCDPTMLLSRDEWLSLLRKEEIQYGKYVFCYFLGETKSHRKAVVRYAKQHNLKIVTFPNLMGNQRLSDRKFGDVKLYGCNPLDFVSLISKAEIVFTDSFHATSFSLYMHTPFYVFTRDAVFSMNSRITCLLDKVGCNDRFVSPNESLDAKSIDWILTDKVLVNEREKGLAYIQRFVNRLNKNSMIL